MGEEPIGRTKPDHGVVGGGLHRGFDELARLVGFLRLIVEAGEEHLLAGKLAVEIVRLPERRQRFVGLLELEQSAAEPLPSAGAVGIDLDPLADLGERRIPLTAGLVDRCLAGMATDIEVALPLGVRGELRRQLLSTIEKHGRIGDHPILEGEIPEDEIGLRIFRELGDGLVEFRAGCSSLLHAQPQGGHHHPRRRHLRVVGMNALEHRPAAVNVAVAEAGDRAVDLRGVGVVGHRPADERLDRHLGRGQGGHPDHQPSEPEQQRGPAGEPRGQAAGGKGVISAGGQEHGASLDSGKMDVGEIPK